MVAQGDCVRNDSGRLRIGRVRVELAPLLGDVDPARLERCLEIFEDYCVVTESVRSGFPIDVGVVLPPEINAIP